MALPDGYDAHNTAHAVAGALSRQPRHMVKTLTWDQGREMARWQHVENATGAKVYFCEPRSPWQRPTNEQTNGLLRRWLPKGTDLNIGTVRLAIIEDRLNTMPRKLHDWHSAHLMWSALLRTIIGEAVPPRFTELHGRALMRLLDGQVEGLAQQNDEGVQQADRRLGQLRSKSLDLTA